MLAQPLERGYGKMAPQICLLLPLGPELLGRNDIIHYPISLELKSKEPSWMVELIPALTFTAHGSKKSLRAETDKTDVKN
jgi:hypothetical protein